MSSSRNLKMLRIYICGLGGTAILFSAEKHAGAVSDHDASELMHLFNEDGSIHKESVQQFNSWEPDWNVLVPFRLKHATPERVKMDGTFCVMARLYSHNYWLFAFQNTDCVSLLEDAVIRENTLSREQQVTVLLCIY